MPAQQQPWELYPEAGTPPAGASSNPAQSNAPAWASYPEAPTAPGQAQQMAATKPLSPSVAADVAKGIVPALAQGAISATVGLPGNLAAARDAGIDKLHRFLLGLTGATPDEIEEERAKYSRAIEAGTWRRAPKALSTADIQQAIEPATGPFYESQTTPGQVAQTILRFAPGALSGEGGAVSNLLKGAVAPGVGATVGRKATEGTWLEGPAELAGAVAGGGIAHVADVARTAATTYGASRNAAQEASGIVGAPVTPGAVSRVAKDMANDALTPEAAADKMQSLGPEGMLLDAGRQLQGRAESIATQPGKGQNTILDAVESRTGGRDPATGQIGSFGKGTADRTRDTLDQTMGETPDVVATRKAIEADVKSRAGPLYDQVMSDHPVVNVPDDITSRPAVAQSMKDAVSLARNYGEKLVSPRPPEELEAAGPGFQMYKDQPPAEPAQTSLRYWDYVKKAMDAPIQKLMRNGGIETLNSSQEKADLGGMIAARNALRDHLDDVTGGAYKVARSVAADKPQLQDALDLGRSALNTKLLPEELFETHDDMSIPAQSMLRAGMRRDVGRIMDTARNDGAAARQLLDTNQNREKIAGIFGQRAADAIDARIAAETQFQDATTNIARNARTARRLQMGKDTESPSISAPPQASILGFLHKGGTMALRNLQQAGTEKTRDAIGSLMTTPAAKVPDLVRVLAGYNQRAAANARPPIAPLAGTLARVLGMDALRRGAQDGQQQQSP